MDQGSIEILLLDENADRPSYFSRWVEDRGSGERHLHILGDRIAQHRSRHRTRVLGPCTAHNSRVQAPAAFCIGRRRQSKYGAMAIGQSWCHTHQDGDEQDKNPLRNLYVHAGFEVGTESILLDPVPVRLLAHHFLAAAAVRILAATLS